MLCKDKLMYCFRNLFFVGTLFLCVETKPNNWEFSQNTETLPNEHQRRTVSMVLSIQSNTEKQGMQWLWVQCACGFGESSPPTGFGFCTKPHYIRANVHIFISLYTFYENKHTNKNDKSLIIIWKISLPVLFSSHIFDTTD